MIRLNDILFQWRIAGTNKPATVFFLKLIIALTYFPFVLFPILALLSLVSFLKKLVGKSLTKDHTEKKYRLWWKLTELISQISKPTQVSYYKTTFLSNARRGLVEDLAAILLANPEVAKLAFSISSTPEMRISIFAAISRNYWSDRLNSSTSELLYTLKTHGKLLADDVEQLHHALLTGEDGLTFDRAHERNSPFQLVITNFESLSGLADEDGIRFYNYMFRPVLHLSMILNQSIFYRPVYDTVEGNIYEITKNLEDHPELLNLIEDNLDTLIEKYLPEASELPHDWKKQLIINNIDYITEKYAESKSWVSSPLRHNGTLALRGRTKHIFDSRRYI